MTTFQTMTAKQWLFAVILAELKNNDNVITKKGVVVDNNCRKAFFSRPRASALPGGREKKAFLSLSMTTFLVMTWHHFDICAILISKRFKIRHPCGIFGRNM